jgi:hypothetical protein
MLIGITGKKGSGKSTVAKRLILKHRFRALPLAKPLKDMLRILGLSQVELEGELKELPCALLGGRSPRHAMQTLGTEWGRKLIHDELWLIAWARNYYNIASQTAIVLDTPAPGIVAPHYRSPSVVVPDVRFDNEAELIRAKGGKIIEISRPGCEGDAHSSEAGVSTHLINYHICNNRTIRLLNSDIDAALAYFKVNP